MAVSPPVPRTRRATGAQDHATLPCTDSGVNEEAAGRLHEAVRAAGGNKAVADRSGVPLGTVNNYVRGRTGMKIEPLSAIATACHVSLDWLVVGAEASATGLPAGDDFPLAVAAAPPGLGDTQAELCPAGLAGGVDLRVLAKAIEVVAAIAGAADFLADPKRLARCIAATYAVLIKPEAARD